MYTDQESNRKEFGTDFLAALDDWGSFKDEPGVIGKVTEIVRFVEDKLGPVTLAYVVDSAQYVAIRFAGNPALGIVLTTYCPDLRLLGISPKDVPMGTEMILKKSISNLEVIAIITIQFEIS